MALAWVSTEARTGKIIADLPDLHVGSVSKTLGRYESAAGSLPLPSAPENWQAATSEGAVHLILLQDDIPVWGAAILRRTRTGGDSIPLSLQTIEGYLTRRYITDVTYTATGQNNIVSDLITNHILDGATPGLPIRVQVTTGGAGALRDRTYKDQDDKTVYSALQDLAGVLGGIEWSIGWEWQHNPERITPVLYVGDRVGAAATPGLLPAATFEMPGPVTDVSHLVDFGAGKGATHVMATSSGQGNLRPQSLYQVAADTSRPTYEHRYTPSTSITEIATLTGHAQGKLAQLAGGTTTVDLSAVLDDAPKLGVDWNIGDDIGYQIGGLDANGEDTVPAFPGGLSGVARAIGWQIELSETSIITPVLYGSEV